MLGQEGNRAAGAGGWRRALHPGRTARQRGLWSEPRHPEGSARRGWPQGPRSPQPHRGHPSCWGMTGSSDACRGRAGRGHWVGLTLGGVAEQRLGHQEASLAPGVPRSQCGALLRLRPQPRAPHSPWRAPASQRSEGVSGGCTARQCLVDGEQLTADFSQLLPQGHRQGQAPAVPALAQALLHPAGRGPESGPRPRARGPRVPKPSGCRAEAAGPRSRGRSAPRLRARASAEGPVRRLQGGELVRRLNCPHSARLPLSSLPPWLGPQNPRREEGWLCAAHFPLCSLKPIFLAAELW